MSCKAPFLILLFVALTSFAGGFTDFSLKEGLIYFDGRPAKSISYNGFNIQAYYKAESLKAVRVVVDAQGNKQLVLEFAEGVEYVNLNLVKRISIDAKQMLYLYM